MRIRTNLPTMAWELVDNFRTVLFRGGYEVSQTLFGPSDSLSETVLSNATDLSGEEDYEIAKNQAEARRCETDVHWAELCLHMTQNCFCFHIYLFEPLDSKEDNVLFGFGELKTEFHLFLGDIELYRVKVTEHGRCTYPVGGVPKSKQC